MGRLTTGRLAVAVILLFPLLVLLLSLTVFEGAPALAAPPNQTPPPGDAAMGKALFMGIVRFQNGGPSCMACHSIAGVGALGGGALGPDLTSAYAKLGEQGINIILSTTPLATMKPVFENRPLTPEEQAHLRVFLQQAPLAERPIESLLTLAALGAAGAAALLLLTHLSWRRRLAGVRRPLVERATQRAPIS